MKLIGVYELDEVVNKAMIYNYCMYNNQNYKNTIMNKKKKVGYIIFTW